MAARVRRVPRCWCTGELWMGRSWGVHSRSAAPWRAFGNARAMRIADRGGWSWLVGNAHLLRHAHAGDMDTTQQRNHTRSPSCKRVRHHDQRPHIQHSLVAIAFATVVRSGSIRCLCIRPFQRHGRLPILQLHRANTAHLGTDSRALPIARLLGTYTVTSRPTHQQQLQHPQHL